MDEYNEYAHALEWMARIALFGMLILSFGVLLFHIGSQDFGYTSSFTESTLTFAMYVLTGSTGWILASIFRWKLQGGVYFVVWKYG